MHVLDLKSSYTARYLAIISLIIKREMFGEHKFHVYHVYLHQGHNANFMLYLSKIYSFREELFSYICNKIHSLMPKLKT